MAITGINTNSSYELYTFGIFQFIVTQSDLMNLVLKLYGLFHDYKLNSVTAEPEVSIVLLLKPNNGPNIY